MVQRAKNIMVRNMVGKNTRPGKPRKVPFFRATGLLVLGVKLMEINSNLFSRSNLFWGANLTKSTVVFSALTSCLVSGKRRDNARKSSTGKKLVVPSG